LPPVLCKALDLAYLRRNGRSIISLPVDGVGRMSKCKGL